MGAGCSPAPAGRIWALVALSGAGMGGGAIFGTGTLS